MKPAHMMKDYMAPMEGITNYIFRNAYHQFFHPMDKYFTPFISAKSDKRLSAKEIREVSPDTNQGLPVVPQILTNNAADFMQTARLLKEYGHKELNLNLGCPSGTVTAKGKGSGFLNEPYLLEKFLDRITEELEKEKMQLSVKTRIGTIDEEDWGLLLEIFGRYPLVELIIHPRIQKDYYKGPLRLDSFLTALDIMKVPLCYNGDLFSKQSYDGIAERFPETEIFMYGRGLVGNPGLVGEIRDGKKMQKEDFRKFHDKIYEDYKELLKDERNVLFRMKELWSYFLGSFSNAGKYGKKIKKAQNFTSYEACVSALFLEQGLIV